MGYGLLAAAIAAEVAGTTAMKYSEGFTRLWPSLLTVAGYLLAFTLLAQTLKTLSVGTAYAIWAGAGTAAIAAIGMVFMGESTSLAKIAGHRAGDRRGRRAQPGRCALMARRYDPERRRRIIDAAIRVVGRERDRRAQPPHGRGRGGCAARLDDVPLRLPGRTAGRRAAPDQRGLRGGGARQRRARRPGRAISPRNSPG